ncbi:MAG: terpene cyclase/mutase family protein [Candidatus Woesearchaeota archaeon]|nr:MAG: terpene cyclase/mutase family protein [Candidatus Woesearchaeota archaeon]
MVEEKEVTEYISRACDFLIRDQNEDGSWSMKHEKLKEPPSPYQNSLIITSQSLQSLIFAVKPKYVDSIKKAINFCINSELSPEDSVDLWAWKLSALNFSNTVKSEKLKEIIIKILKEKQEESGCWPYYPHTFTLTNYSVCNALPKEKVEETISKAIKWFKKARKGKGWSRDDKDDKIEPSFTANGILSLIKLGEQPPKEAVDYLESEQEDNGGWRVLSDSGQWENVTSYSTALCVSSLLLANGSREKVEKGMEYLLKCQDESGRILRSPNEKETYHYLFYYVIQALELYLYSKNNILDLHKFEEEKKQQFLFACYRNVLNSRALGVTEQSRIRRKDILRALEEGDKEVAEIIDYLKKDNKYQHLNKKSHITQIKSDVEYLRSIKLIGKRRESYYISTNLLQPLTKIF